MQLAKSSVQESYICSMFAVEPQNNSHGSLGAGILALVERLALLGDLKGLFCLAVVESLESPLVLGVFSVDSL